VVRCTLRERKVPSSILGIPNLKSFLNFDAKGQMVMDDVEMRRIRSGQ
jgi:hypothetical protein